MKVDLTCIGRVYIPGLSSETFQTLVRKGAFLCGGKSYCLMLYSSIKSGIEYREKKN